MKRFAAFYPVTLRALAVMMLMSLLMFNTSIVFAQVDGKAPSYVDNVEAFPGDSSVRLTWDAATDNVGVTAYKIYMGTETVDEVGETYNMKTIDTGNVLEYTVKSLKNGTTYYFAVTALDAAGNESVEYSVEVSATPTTAGDDGKNPVVISATPLACDEIEVEFSEAVKLVNSDGVAFAIENIDDLNFLDVNKVTQSKTNAKALLLETDEMADGAQYLMTVATSVQDLFGNPIVSGTSDTAVFSGVECAPEEPEPTEPEDETAPELKTVTVVDATTLEIEFDEMVMLPMMEEDGEMVVDQETAMAMFEVFNDDKSLDIENVAYKEMKSDEAGAEPELDKMVVVLTVSEMDGETAYFLSVIGLEDEAGNATVGDDLTSATNFTAPRFEPEEPTEPEADTVAPEDVTNLVANVVDMLVNLDWTASVNSAGDLVDQMLYVSTDGGNNYTAGESLGDDAVDYTFEGGVEGQTYTFKVTTKDGAGNESEGAVVTATLPTTGAGVGLLALASVAGGTVFNRRKKQK